MKLLPYFMFACMLLSFVVTKKKPVIVWQPSHQTNTGKDFNEALVSNAIAEAAMATPPAGQEYKVWSLGRKDVHDADSGSNTVIKHTTAVIDGKISGYAWELEQSNQHKPDVFIALHNNGGTKRHAIWGYIHYGDAYEAAEPGTGRPAYGRDRSGNQPGKPWRTF